MAVYPWWDDLAAFLVAVSCAIVILIALAELP